jgi:hypothetical protein
MTRCTALGSVEIHGRTVGVIRCGLDAGHDAGPFPRIIRTAMIYPERDAIIQREPSPHRAVLEWVDASAKPDLALLDPHERFDVDVPLAPLPDDYL